MAKKKQKKHIQESKVDVRNAKIGNRRISRILTLIDPCIAIIK